MTVRRLERRAIGRWLAERWPGIIPATGFMLGLLEFGGRLAGRRIDPEVIPFAVALILWRPVQRHQARRNGQRDDSDS